ncbi:MAG: hypothetical protein ACRD0K_25220 [Egibacteraceae bacterium]
MEGRWAAYTERVFEEEEDYRLLRDETEGISSAGTAVFEGLGRATGQGGTVVCVLIGHN